MALKVIYSVLILPLLLAQTVESVVRLYYCTFTDRGICEPNIFVDRPGYKIILDGHDVEGLNINLTCASTQAIRWVIDVTDESGLEGQEPVIQVQQKGNSSTLTYIMNVQAPLAHFMGTIRCHSHDNLEDYAQVFIDTSKYFQLMGKNGTINFFITKGEGRVVIPCAGKSPKTGKVKLLKVSGNKKAANLVSEKCLKCILHSYNESHAPIICGSNSSTCGYFNISASSWENAGQRLPTNNDSSGYEDLEDWKRCAMDYDCAVATVMSQVWRTRRDCNGDGSITCEDYFLIHRYGFEKCGSEKENGGGSKFIEHKTCPRDMPIEEDITAKATYDQSLGFILNEMVDHEALYFCSSPMQDVQYTYVPVDSTKQVASKMSLQSVGFGNDTTVSCTFGTERLTFTRLVVAFCLSLTQCDLKFRPYRDLGKIEGGQLGITSKDPTSKRSLTLSFNEGIVGCVGVDYNNSSIVKYVRHFDYYFTGLDARTYFVSSEFPTSAVLRLSLELKDQTKGHLSSLELTCRASTFLALPIFGFAFHYSNGSVHHLPLGTVLSEGPLQTNYGQLSRIRKLGAEAERSLELKPSHYITHVSCTVLLMNSNDWINKTLALPIESPVTKGSVAWTAIISVSSALCLVLLGATVCIIIRLKLRLRVLTKQEERDFFDGDQTSATTTAHDEIRGFSIDTVGFPNRFRLPQESYVIDWGIELGSGEFGCCYKGFLRQNDQNVPVAIKTLKNTADKEYFKSFLKEIKVRAYVAEHENVVKFYGAMVERISEQKCHAIMELSPLGDLRSFIVLHFVAPGSLSTVGSPAATSGYSTLELMTLPQHHLIHFCEQIAAAMEHIASKEVVHGDLAARNVLVFPNLVVKVTDFGLARRMYESGIYSRVNSQIPLPWRWMAPESLRSLEFSTASDVWSFGLTCWEILTLGDVPFAELQSSRELLQFVSNGSHLPRPACATTETYDFLLRCWSIRKSERPSFSEAKVFFGALLQSTRCDYSRIVPAELLDETTC